MKVKFFETDKRGLISAGILLNGQRLVKPLYNAGPRHFIRHGKTSYFFSPAQDHAAQLFRENQDLKAEYFKRPIA